MPRVCLHTASLFTKLRPRTFLKFIRSTSVLNVDIKLGCDGMFDAPDQILRKLCLCTHCKKSLAAICPSFSPLVVVSCTILHRKHLLSILLSMSCWSTGRVTLYFHPAQSRNNCRGGSSPRGATKGLVFVRGAVAALMKTGPFVFSGPLYHQVVANTLQISVAALEDQMPNWLKTALKANLLKFCFYAPEGSHHTSAL